MSSRLSFTLLITILLMPLLPLAQESPAQSSSSKAKQNSEQHVKASVPTVSDQGLYRNSEFGFSYRVRYGWVDRTRQMEEESNDSSKSKLLLAAFERPPEASGETINSAVIIAAESAASYPGLKTAADYMEPLTELTTSKGFKVVHEPYEFPVSGKAVVRSDFVKELGNLTMRQSSLVLLEKHSLVSFTFIGGSEDEVEELIEKLTLSLATKRH
jgi:hypothetical protein